MAERVLAVIPCFNEESHIEKLARRLLAAAQDLPMRIAIADGDSTDRTPEIAQKLAHENTNLLYLKNPKRRQAAGVNLAAATYGADAEFLIRIDAHADYPRDYCQTLVQEAQQTGADAVAVRMITAGDGWFQRAVSAVQNSRLGHGGALHRTAGGDGQWVDHGHHALIRLDAFRAVGGYDASFSHNEDAEFDTRLVRAGRKIWLSGKTAAIYYPRSSPVALFRQYMRHGEGRARHILKHRVRPKWRQLLPALVLPTGLLALLGLFHGPAAWPLAAWIVFCLGYGIALGVRAKDTAIGLLAGFAAMIMHVGWSCGFWRGIVKSFFGSYACER
ncbi:MAG TPA: glycosyltransferase family 2 protein [Alphaproteobacteria bacterium]|nr:glycosyltransferase family 2 protein [Alphaproteobacteria bacterium]